MRARRGKRDAVLTIGYGGFEVGEFVAALRIAGVGRIIDVRNNARSRKAAFNGKALRASLEAAGIEYQHCPELGIPKAKRAKIRTPADRAALFAQYGRELTTQDSALFARVAAWLREKPSALMCLESDPAECHRSTLAQFLGERFRMPVEHLAWPRAAEPAPAKSPRRRAASSRRRARP